MEIPQNSLARSLPSQLFFLTGETPEAIVEQLEVLESFLEKSQEVSLCDLAYKLYLENSKKKQNPNNQTLAIVTESLEELKKKIKFAKDLLKQHPEVIPASHFVGGGDYKGIYFSSNPIPKPGKIAFIFSGQGSQRPNMLKDLTVLFPQMQESISRADLVLKNRFPKLLSEYIYLSSSSTPQEEQLNMEKLTQTNIAQPALGAVETGLLKIMKLFGVNPDMVAGHSLGEYVALYAGGVFEEEILYELLEYRGSTIINSSKGGDLGKMLAVGGNAKDIEGIIKEVDNVYIANLNSPTQTILSGNEEALDLASSKLEEKGFRSKKINVSCAFHSPYMAPARDLLFKKLSSLDFKTSLIPVYSNLTATQYPEDKKSILSILSNHLISPVNFTDEVENMFRDGAKIFIEIGPGNVLTNLIKQILDDKEYLAIPSNIKTVSDISQILNVLAQLMAEGFKVNISPIFEDRNFRVS